jgi:hypothetical protein
MVIPPGNSQFSETILERAFGKTLPRRGEIHEEQIGEMTFFYFHAQSDVRAIGTMIIGACRWLQSHFGGEAEETEPLRGGMMAGVAL